LFVAARLAAAAIEPDLIFALIEAVEPPMAKAEEAHDINERLLDQSYAIPCPIGKVTIRGNLFELDASINARDIADEAALSGSLLNWSNFRIARASLVAPGGAFLALCCRDAPQEEQALML